MAGRQEAEGAEAEAEAKEEDKDGEGGEEGEAGGGGWDSRCPTIGLYSCLQNPLACAMMQTIEGLVRLPHAIADQDGGRREDTPQGNEQHLVFND